jgi:hypothetical protein
MRTITSLYERGGEAMLRIARLEHIPHVQTLQYIAWVLLFGWFLEFYTWFQYSDFTQNAVDAGRHLCWPFFQSCGDWYFLAQFPYANTHGLVYAILFGLLVFTAFSLARSEYRRAIPIFWIFFAWECIVLLFSMRLATPYWYFHVFFVALFLLPSAKIAFLRIGTVLLYFFAGLLKLDAGWLQGAYFKSLAEGVYFVPDTLIPFATNMVIAMELVLVWGLFSRRTLVRRSVIGVLVAFHMYSVLYVGFAYPAVILPMILVLFWNDPIERLPTRRDVAGWILIALLIVSNLSPFLVSGSARKFTLEGNKYGVFMFDANYQCKSEAVFIHNDGSEETESSETTSAKARCDPYAGFFYLKQRCIQDPSIEKIVWSMQTSVNGSPFLKIVDVENACDLEYRASTHNEWIKIPGVDDVERGETPPPSRYPLSG